MMDMLTSILPGGNAKDNAPHGLTEANLRELNAGVNPHKERKLSNASQASIEKAVSTLGIEAMRAAQTAVVIGEDNRLAQTAVKDATGEEVSLGAQKQESGAVDVADLDVSVLDGSLVDGSNSSPKSVMPSATETLRPRKNSGGASAIKAMERTGVAKSNAHTDKPFQKKGRCVIS